PVERSDRHRNPFAVDEGKRERRAAITAKPARCEVRRHEDGNLAARNGKGGFGPSHQRSVKRAERLLAHAAMADMRARWLLAEPVAHRPALTTAAIGLHPRPPWVARPWCRGQGVGSRPDVRKPPPLPASKPWGARAHP